MFLTYLTNSSKHSSTKVYKRGQLDYSIHHYISTSKKKNVLNYHIFCSRLTPLTQPTTDTHNGHNILPPPVCSSNSVLFYYSCQCKLS